MGWFLYDIGLRRERVKYSFQDTLNPSCNCGIDVESCTHFLLKCIFFLRERCVLMSNLNKIDPQVSKLTLSNLTNTLLFVKLSFSDKINALILDATTEYTRSTKRFDEPLF